MIQTAQHLAETVGVSTACTALGVPAVVFTARRTRLGAGLPGRCGGPRPPGR